MCIRKPKTQGCAHAMQRPEGHPGSPVGRNLRERVMDGMNRQG
ncbi:hypothetical protein AvCA_15360 [Azotobacter vinelandii CA]|uniref:Uncharacterized protein n=2 Tax=Azotobacter vinelandii TaxID=354 RepID=C1DRL3_AZOVD|nr:hypothetical protein Avin_15360 [Azotobacter vinelandii DJ]AGK16987.1 hypothetical protein AvCA_15360 [Azotobacter vinelandii CA]AGK19956.1 hypothetical protein AvCA6_15360 [Azotobacter vinelandii CA6]